MISNKLHQAMQTEVRTKVIYNLIQRYNALYLRYMNDSEMSEGEYHMRRKIIAEMIKDYKCYDDVRHLVEEFEENNPC